MIIKLQIEEESLVRSGEFDIAIPFSVTKYCESGETDVKAYPSLRGAARAFVQRFRGDVMFSDAAIAAAKVSFGAFLDAHSFVMGEESDDYFRKFRLVPPNARCILDSTHMIGRRTELDNLTGYDIDALKQFGHLCCATVIDGKIVSAACTNVPVLDGGEIEIGVETAPEYEGRGYGKSNVAALASALAERGCTALYECASKNIASVKLAQRVGGVEYARNYYIVGIRQEF